MHANRHELKPRTVARPLPGGGPDFAPSFETPGGFVGQAALQLRSSISRQQAAPGNVSAVRSSIGRREWIRLRQA
jgi:hypothetical protein